MSAVETRPAVAPASEAEDLHHLVCCRGDDPGNVALCGTDVTNATWLAVFEHPCVVCHDLAETDACPVYGRCTE